MVLLFISLFAVVTRFAKHTTLLSETDQRTDGHTHTHTLRYTHTTRMHTINALNMQHMKCCTFPYAPTQTTYVYVHAVTSAIPPIIFCQLKTDPRVPTIQSSSSQCCPFFQITYTSSLLWCGVFYYARRNDVHHILSYCIELASTRHTHVRSS